MTRLLITGASGLLGLNLALDASGSYEVIGVDRNKLSAAPFPIIKADLLEPKAISNILNEARPEAVIHCAAMADVDACESDPEVARQINTELPGRLATECANRRIRFVHISTDAVFNGEKTGYYSESDPPTPHGVYSTTKYEAEIAVGQANPAAIIARVNFYGWSLSGKRSLAEFFVNSMSSGKTVNGFTDVTFCPMLVNSLGEILIKMLERDMHGLYHVVGQQAMSKFQFGVEIARKFGLRENLIFPLSVDKSNLAARRSHNLSLSIHKLSTDLGPVVPDFSTGLDKFHAQFKQGYPQKIRSYQQD